MCYAVKSMHHLVGLQCSLSAGHNKGVLVRLWEKGSAGSRLVVGVLAERCLWEAQQQVCTEKNFSWLHDKAASSAAQASTPVPRHKGPAALQSPATAAQDRNQELHCINQGLVTLLHGQCLLSNIRWLKRVIGKQGAAAIQGCCVLLCRLCLQKAASPSRSSHDDLVVHTSPPVMPLPLAVAIWDKADCRLTATARSR